MASEPNVLPHYHYHEVIRRLYVNSGIILSLPYVRESFTVKIL